MAATAVQNRIIENSVRNLITEHVYLASAGTSASDHEVPFAPEAPDNRIVCEQRRHRLDRTALRTSA